MAIEKATVLNLETSEQFAVSFNPEEYALDAGNQFAELTVPGLRIPPLQFAHGKARRLRMELMCDTYEVQLDVRRETRRITDLLEVHPALKGPPRLLFTWGAMQFRCVLENVEQRFTLFFPSGTPARAYLDVTFREHETARVEIQRGTVAVPAVFRNVVQGETLSKIAGQVLGDPGRWRELAGLNRIDNPRKLPAGRPLALPVGRS